MNRRKSIAVPRHRTSPLEIVCTMPTPSSLGSNRTALNQEATLTILMPCLNEARTLATCITKAQAYLVDQGILGEIVVADNGSTDGSREIAESLGARVVPVPRRGYGSALQAGIEAAHGKFVIMGDSDDSYDFASLNAFVEKLKAGYDLVVGNRYEGGIRSGAMPPLHRYFGNPLLTAIGRRLYKSPLNDFYCGLRGFRRDAILRLGLSSLGMEFALEMIVKSTIHGLRITEVPTVLSPDGRGRPPHLRSWRDGWRSLRIYLLLSPEGLFLYPGLALAMLGALASSALIFTNVKVGPITFAQHTLIITSALTVIGIQSAFFWVFAKSVAIEKQLLFVDSRFEAIRRLFGLEKCLVSGGLSVAIGLAIACYGLFYWHRFSFGEVKGETLIRIVCAASTLTSIGFQLIFSSFFMYLLDQQSDRTRSLASAEASEKAAALESSVTAPDSAVSAPTGQNNIARPSAKPN
jgi:glycosyltransferase involved in cell wall biosynthesis